MISSSFKPLIIVAGQTRSGTTLVTLVLRAAGLRVPEPPPFEPSESNALRGPIDMKWARRYDAIKLVDPHRTEFRDLNGVKVIILRRDSIQQAKSMIKFMRFTGSLPKNAGIDLGRIALSFRRDQELVDEMFSTTPNIRLSFEEAVLTPRIFCEKVARFLEPERFLNTKAMLGAFIPRRNGAACQPNMEIEEEIIRV